jgi:hypothetical protein
MQSDGSSPAFQKNPRPPSSGPRGDPSKEPVELCLAYSLTLKMDAVHFSETFVIFYQTPRQHIPRKTILPHFVNLSMVTCLHFMLSVIQI